MFGGRGVGGSRWGVDTHGYVYTGVYGMVVDE